jgi:very-short-patch-repair endonuclease
MPPRLTTEQFITRSRTIHGDNYDYSKFTYNGSKVKGIITYPEHGDFKQLATVHLQGKGCPKCVRMSTEKMLIIFGAIHGAKYDYSKFKYQGYSTKSTIICKTHGEFQQTPYNHKQGKGCPKCKNSKGESKVKQFLDNRRIEYLPEHRFEDCRDKRSLPFDFYIPSKNLIIEYDGKQHFIPYSKFGGTDALLKTQHHDQIKTKYCEDNKIHLIRIRYDQVISEVLSEVF